MRGAPVIFVRQGNLGNQMIQFMFAHRLSRKAGGVKIVGNNMPEWGLVSAALKPPVGSCVRTGPLHKIDLDALADILKSGEVDWVDLDCYAQRREYFEEDRDSFARMFLSPVTGEVLSKDEIAIHVRTGDIVAGLHRDYMPLPLAYYHRLIDETGCRPVFVGQVSGNFYTDALRRQFADARFIGGADRLRDFQTIRNARNIAIAVGTFSWLAAYLSATARIIHYPVLGMLNPAQRPDIDLMPTNDRRYIFHPFTVEHYAASAEQVAALTAAPPAASLPAMISSIRRAFRSRPIWRLR